MKQLLTSLILSFAASSAFADCNMIDMINVNDPANGAFAVTQCLSQGGDMNRADKNGWTPLHWAVVTANPNAAKALLAAGANPNPRDGDNATPIGLISPTADPQASVALLRVLAVGGADLNVEDDYKETPLSFAAGFNSGGPLVKELLTLGANPNLRQSNGRTALFSTIQGDCRADIGNMLLDAGADPKKIDAFYLDLLLTASRILCADDAKELAYRDRLATLAAQ